MEWECSKGTFVALTNKSYQCLNLENDDLKKSTKGIPHRNEFSMKLFQDVLLDENLPRQTVTINSLRRDRNKEMCRMQIEKTSLSDVFLKMRVESDKVECTPLTINGSYL